MEKEDRIAGMDIFAGDGEAAVRETIDRLEKMQFAKRLWRRDPGLWKSDAAQQRSISNALGWLDVARKMESNLRSMTDFAAELKSAGFEHVVHMGMGGSSLAPLVFRHVFGQSGQGLPLTVLDTTDPATVLEIERQVPIARTLFIEASKSGSTVESRSFGEYFYSRLKAIRGNLARENFAVITDPGSRLAGLAESRCYRRIFTNFPDIGGRYSALSYFGLVPAALMGMDLVEMLARAKAMSEACAATIPVRENPGVLLGAVAGGLALKGRNKATFLLPASIAPFGMWLEQLIAESTGKEGTGITPIVGEPLAAPSVYGSDRFFVYLRLESEVEESLERGVEALRTAGQPVVTIRMADRMDLCREIFRWQIATAAAGAILGINPFDQPNVQESKECTHQLLSQLEEKGTISGELPGLFEPPLEIHTDAGDKMAAEVLARFLGTAREGDYVALLAYLTESAGVEKALQSIRTLIRDRFGMAVTAGYGPRYLHSTGQLHKGGPDTGLFLILSADERQDAPIPEKPYTFAHLRQAQAMGDLKALRGHGRRVLRVHMSGDDPVEGLAALLKLM